MSSIKDALLAASLFRPYYAKAISALEPIESDKQPTVAVDKYWRLYYNPKWLAEHSDEECGHVIGAHEVEHLLRNHHDRGKAIDADCFIFNVAGDAEINDDLPKEILTEGIRPSHIGCKDNLLAEEYYNKLIDQAKKVSAKSVCGGGSGAGNPLPFEKGPGENSITENDAEELRDAVANDVREFNSKNPGKLPGAMLVWANARIRTVRIDWRKNLLGIISRKTREIARGRDDYNRSIISRRGMASNLILPGMSRYIPHIGIVADTSGSMESYGDTVISHVHKLSNGLGRVSVWSCDVEAVKTSKYKFVGGGGTDMRVGICAAEEAKVDVVIVITDGYTPWPDHKPKTPVIIVMCGNDKQDTPGWCKNVINAD